MRIATVTDSHLLTYCGNVHAATDVDQWIEMTRRFAVPIAAGRKAVWVAPVWKM